MFEPAAGLGALLCLAVLVLFWHQYLRDWLGDIDPAARLGISGLLGLGAVGWLLFFVGYIPGSLKTFGYLHLLIAMLLVAILFRKTFLRPLDLPIAKPAGVGFFVTAACLLCAVVALVAVLAPSDINDWDSLAYHLAVPKLWQQAGQIYYIPYIHHSNFPFLVENLNLLWRDGSAAKATIFAFSILGAFTVFGIARQKYGDKAAWWSLLAFCTVPVVLWESGSAYIDVAHGLFSGLAVVLALMWGEKFDKRYLWLSAIFLGFSIGSKYTGLQVTVVLLAALFALAVRTPNFAKVAKGGVLIAIVGVLIGAPWYVRNAVVVGNPVFPFFYEKLGGKNWSDFNAQIYRNEQQTFGVGRTETGRDVTQIGHAILGLAYQPGRYVNPGQTEGHGFPFGALGAVTMVAAMLWMLAGRAGRFEGGILFSTFVSLGMWFFLSQQSRYGMNFALPLVFLAGAGVTRLRAGPMLSAAIALQAVYSLWMVWTTTTTPKLPVVLGKETREEYMSQAIPFFEPAQLLNEAAKSGKIALYDEVFGYLLEPAYFWANPGHCTIIPYDEMASGDDLAKALRDLGFTHVYVNLGFWSSEDRIEWLRATGVAGEAVPYTSERRQALVSDPQASWRLFLAEAIASGKLAAIQDFPAKSLEEGRVPRSFLIVVK
ncbi:MAG: glycosyltransferase family 39 protein [Fimbriimonadaceae bacterium]|nr:glycosyltransferase family 39 protein [Fimbriimonadaceae bacterium]